MTSPSASAVVRTLAPLRTPQPWLILSAAQGLRSAFESLAAHKLRSGLTVLGTAVGVAAVLVIGVFGQLSEAAVVRQFGQLGATLVSVQPEEPLPSSPGEKLPAAGGAGQTGGKPALRLDLDDKDAQAIRALPHVVATSPHVLAPPQQVVAGGQNRTVRVQGVFPEVQRILGYEVRDGTFFSDQDEAAGAQVAVVGARVAQSLFPEASPVGQSARIGRVDFSIVGVLAPQGSSGESELDGVIFIPYSAINRIRGNARVVSVSSSPLANSGVLIQVDSVHNVPQVETSVSELVNQLHPPKAGQLPYVTRDFKQAVRAQEDTTSTLTLVMTGVAGIALAIGALGLLSIMTVTVTERTREIGVRMAVGARHSDVLLQFLIEAATLSVVGGLVGLALGLAVAPLAPQAVRQFAGLRAIPSPTLIAAALLVSLVIGVVFGFLPARRAARLDPVAALRRD